jgi:glutamate synthase domain-containing protein 3
LDLSNLLYSPEVGPEVGYFCQVRQDHGLENSLDRRQLLEICQPALEKGEKVGAILPIRNIHRVVGTILGSEITKRKGAAGLPQDTIKLHFQGNAGQSFGAFVPKGVTLELEGDANDYLGKGLSGGKIVVYPPLQSTFKAEANIIIGNVALYGATGGEAYIAGAAGERFAVRNSGVQAVVESVGDHGCEYMTGGKVVILGSTGRNFAAGMSGGIAYILDETGDFETRCNGEMVDLEPLTDREEIEGILVMIQRHAVYTGSERAKTILTDWENYRPRFVKVIPRDYKRVLEALKQVEQAGIKGEDAFMAAFEANKSDLKRVSGN